MDRRTRDATDWIFVIRDGAMAALGAVGVVLMLALNLPNVIANAIWPPDDKPNR
jgi:hypothetical protein